MDEDKTNCKTVRVKVLQTVFTKHLAQRLFCVVFYFSLHHIAAMFRQFPWYHTSKLPIWYNTDEHKKADKVPNHKHTALNFNNPFQQTDTQPFAIFQALAAPTSLPFYPRRVTITRAQQEMMLPRGKKKRTKTKLYVEKINRSLKRTCVFFYFVIKTGRNETGLNIKLTCCCLSLAATVEWRC